MYPAHLTAPMAAELTDNGFESLTTADHVDNAVKSEGTTLVVINSVCGCAAANARPGAIMAMKHSKTPDRSVTVFAGVDQEAVQRTREHLIPYPPSSPSMALFKDGKLVHFIPRHLIEGRTAAMVADNLKMAFDEYC